MSAGEFKKLADEEALILKTTYWYDLALDFP
jgi:hypothetical protein